MRTVRYDRFPAVGPDAVPEEASLLQFVLDIPYLFPFGLIPPICVLNDVFLAGLEDSGMSGGCLWEPFTIEAREYEELVHALMAMTEAHYRVPETPEWVKSRDDWRAWTMEHEIGIPHEAFSTLSREDAKWTRLKRQAQEKGDEELAMEYHVKGLEAGKRLAEYIAPYIAKYQGEKGRS